MAITYQGRPCEVLGSLVSGLVQIRVAPVQATAAYQQIIFVPASEVIIDDDQPVADPPAEDAPTSARRGRKAASTFFGSAQDKTLSDPEPTEGA